ncbi:MAG: phage scaffolding protein [Lachnospiraceae bacterium]
MEFLKELLGDELYSQLKAKINEHNSNESNKDNQIKIGNLGKGEYVGKGKYDSEIEKLQNLLTSKDTELTTANGLIAELKKGTKGNEELQGKITTYETQVADLQNELQETKIKSAIKVALLSEKAVDVDYLSFKLNEKLKENGESLELDENENIKGWKDKLEGLKTQFPTMFESAGKDGFEPYKKDGLPNGGLNESEPENLADALRMQYENNE